MVHSFSFVNINSDYIQGLSILLLETFVLLFLTKLSKITIIENFFWLVKIVDEKFNVVFDEVEIGKKLLFVYMLVCKLVLSLNCYSHLIGAIIQFLLPFN